MEKSTKKIDISVVIPVKDENDNLKQLFRELVDNLQVLDKSYELIFIDDGSSDGSKKILRDLAKDDNTVKVIYFRRNYGQTAAMQAGFDHAQGDVIIAMDADLQNDPADIPKLLEKIDEGYDLVSGWRKRRKDKMLTRRIPSMIANRLINKLIEATGVQLNDFGCTLKAYKKYIIKNIHIYGEMHRFIPAFAGWLGVKVAEIEVNHRPRVHGQTKYNLSRVTRVIFDLIVVRFFADYMTKPIQFFGKLAIKVMQLALLVIIACAGLKYFINVQISYEFMTIIFAMFAFAAMQLLSVGLLGEILVRSYFEGQGKRSYEIEEVL